ncbi:MAG: hypothetical protein ACI82H_000746 [Alphaproteobacteria bacterium]|jgi:hypothetical protein
MGMGIISVSGGKNGKAHDYGLSMTILSLAGLGAENGLLDKLRRRNET